ncbi:MAG TPA: hypothetical protein VGO90_00245 [Chthoniobacteraceae bacterium]|nr:hypothetical protein [Chthoniobacteraceae bacterium]
MTTRTALTGSLVAATLALTPYTASAQTVIEQAAEHRFQLDFRVNDEALAQMLPAGWQAVIATQGPAKDANLRMIFIDRMAIIGGDGKPAARPTARLVYLAIPVKETATGTTGQMIIHGLTENEADAPGDFGVYQHATTAKMSRTVTAAGGVLTGSEDWEFASARGERLEVHVEYVRGPATKGGAEVKFFDRRNPGKYQIFKTDQAIDIMRNPTTTPPDHIRKFSYKAGGGRIRTLFDGTEKVVSWDSFPWYIRTVSTP